MKHVNSLQNCIISILVLSFVCMTLGMGLASHTKLSTTTGTDGTMSEFTLTLGSDLQTYETQEKNVERPLLRETEGLHGIRIFGRSSVLMLPFLLLLFSGLPYQTKRIAIRCAHLLHRQRFSMIFYMHSADGRKR